MLTPTTLRTPLPASPVKQCSQRQSPNPSLQSLLHSKQQTLHHALQSEETLEAEREEMLSVVTNLKDRHRLEAIFEQERIVASHRLLALAQALDQRILQTASSATHKPVEEN